MNNFANTFDVRLPAWDEAETIPVRLRRVSLLTMAAQGDVPNELLAAAQRLFGGEAPTALPIDQMGRMMIAIARDALVEPTYDQICGDNGSLTDMQLAAIYSFTQAGVRALLPFRDDSSGSGTAGDVQAVRGETE